MASRINATKIANIPQPSQIGGSVFMLLFDYSDKHIFTRMNNPCCKIIDSAPAFT
jgi:hypothetical protein